MGRGAATAIVLAGLCMTAPTPSAAQSDWKALDWLVGSWTATGGNAQSGTGGFSFTREAGGRLLMRKNFAAYPARNGQPASRHDDLMVIEHAGPDLRATYWDDEGHQIHYAVSAPAEGSVLFLSTDAAGPHYRLSYRRTTAGLEGRFEIAPPDKPAVFQTYLTWTARRTT
jgi:hypothetical protein